MKYRKEPMQLVLSQPQKSLRQMATLVLLSVVVLVGPTEVLHAGKLPYSPEQLQKLSSVIVTGTVIAIEHRTIAESVNVFTIRWTATLASDTVEKGSVAAGNLKLSYITSGGGQVLCGPAQDPVPQIGDRCRAHLEPQVTFEETELFPLLAPNGWEILDTAGRTGEKPTNLDGLVNPRSVTGAAGTVLIALLFFVLWRVFRNR